MISLEQRPKPRGVLDPAGLRDKLTLRLSFPSAELAWLVEHYWMVEWELAEGESYRQYTVPQPNVHLVVVPGMCGVFGVMNRLFSYLLSGKGRVFGIKFAPGAFRALMDGPISAITDKHLPAESVLGRAGRDYERSVLDWTGEEEGLRDLAESYLRSLAPVADENHRLITGLIERVKSDQGILQVDQLLDGVSMSKRTLQRLFREYVGVGPKWVINRYRIVEAADRLGAGQPVDFAALAAELRYFDQAHFIRDFKGLIGRSPGEYAKQAALARRPVSPGPVRQNRYRSGTARANSGDSSP